MKSNKVLMLLFLCLLALSLTACGGGATDEGATEIEITGTTLEMADFDVLVPDGWSVIDAIGDERTVYISEDANRTEDGGSQGSVYVCVEYNDLYQVEYLENGIPNGEDVWRDGEYGEMEEHQFGDNVLVGGLTTYYVGESCNDCHYWSNSDTKVYEFRSYNEVPSDENQAAIKAILTSFKAK